MNSIRYNSILLTIILAISAISVSAQTYDNSLVAYTRLGVGARMIAMGEAGSTAAHDVSSGYWNPSGLSQLKDFEVGTMLNVGLDNNRSHSYAALGKRFGFGAVSLSWINAGVGDIDGYDENGEPTGTFSDQEHCISLSYANNIGPVSFGFSPKFYLSTIESDSETGYGLDAGVKFDLNQYLEMGFMARDIYGKLGESTLPYELSGGLAIYPVVGLTLAADAKLPRDEAPYFCFGAEYWTSIGKDSEADSKLSVVEVRDRGALGDAVASLETGLRLGYNQGRFSAGTGIRIGNFQLDYTFRLNNHDLFGDDHILSLILRF